MNIHVTKLNMKVNIFTYFLFRSKVINTSSQLRQNPLHYGKI